MENDEQAVVDTAETAAPVETEATETKEPQEDYRGKLNATNRFLEKEGYTFDDGRWKAPAKPPSSVPSKQTGDLSQKDVLYLAKADVHEEDLDSVLEWATLKKIPVSQAKTEMQPILDKRTEERRTAAATNTKGGARGTSEVSGEDLLAQAQRGEEVEMTEENATKIFQARLARKTAKYKKR